MSICFSTFSDEEEEEEGAEEEEKGGRGTLEDTLLCGCDWCVVHLRCCITALLAQTALLPALRRAKHTHAHQCTNATILNTRHIKLIYHRGSVLPDEAITSLLIIMPFSTASREVRTN